MWMDPPLSLPAKLEILTPGLNFSGRLGRPSPLWLALWVPVLECVSVGFRTEIHLGQDLNSSIMIPSFPVFVSPHLRESLEVPGFLQFPTLFVGHFGDAIALRVGQAEAAHCPASAPALQPSNPPTLQPRNLSRPTLRSAGGGRHHHFSRPSSFTRPFPARSLSVIVLPASHMSCTILWPELSTVAARAVRGHHL
jgi:hypothetical protein